MHLLQRRRRAGPTTTLINDWVLWPQYRDLSNKVSIMAPQACKNLNRPPTTHDDRGYWHWARCWEPHNQHFRPNAVPPLPIRAIRTGPGGVPDCPILGAATLIQSGGEWRLSKVLTSMLRLVGKDPQGPATLPGGRFGSHREGPQGPEVSPGFCMPLQATCKGPPGPP